jgi:hypothetical protein
MPDQPQQRKVEFGIAVPDPAMRYIPLIMPQPGVPLRAVVLGKKAISCLVHWQRDDRVKGGGRTVPHTIPDDTCPHCVVGNQRPRWHAYLAAWMAHTSRYVIVDISVHAAQSCTPLDPRSGVNLRGLEILLRRIGTSRNSPVVAELGTRRIDESALAAEFDIPTALMRLWGVNTAGDWRTDANGL